MAAGLWGPVWEGHHVQFHIDNMAVLVVIQNLNARDNHLGHLLHCLHSYATYYCFNLSAAHIPGIQNTAADALSHGDLFHFHSLFPQVWEHTVPPELLSPLLQPAADWSSHIWMAQWRASFRPALLSPYLQPTTPGSHVFSLLPPGRATLLPVMVTIDSFMNN